MTQHILSELLVARLNGPPVPIDGPTTVASILIAKLMAKADNGDVGAIRLIWEMAENASCLTEVESESRIMVDKVLTAANRMDRLS